MKYLKMFNILILIAFCSNASEVVLVQVDFPMSKNENVSSDVYVTGDYKMGTILALSRSMFVRLQKKEHKFTELNIPFALIKVIHSEGSLSIGKLVYVHDKNELPLIKNYSAILGDKVLPPTKYLLDGYKSNNSSKQSQVPIQKREVAGDEIIL